MYVHRPGRGTWLTYVGDLFHVFDHFIVAFGLLAQPRKEGLAGEMLDYTVAGGAWTGVPFALERRIVSMQTLSGSQEDLETCGRVNNKRAGGLRS